MKHRTLFACSVVAFAATLAKAGPADDAKAAAAKLADATNYSWTTTTTNAGGGGGGGGGFNAGPVTGKAEKGGFAVTTRQGQNGPMQTVIKGEQRVMQTPGGWATAEEIRAQMQGGGGGGGGGGNRFRGGFGGGPLPAAELANLIGLVKEFKVVDGALVGDLSAESVGPMLTGGGRGPGGGGQGGPPPAPKNASGIVKIWLKDGAVAKYELQVKGTVAGRDGNERQIDRTTTTAITDVGTTKVEVPDAAKAKFT